MSLDERIANLIETGALKEAARDGPLIRQYLLNAQQLREDADAAKSTIGRFLLAYDGLHALAMAFLTDRGLRTGGEGHRSTALQLAIGELTKDAPFAGAVSAIILIHKARNDFPRSRTRCSPPRSSSLMPRWLVQQPRYRCRKPGLAIRGKRAPQPLSRSPPLSGTCGRRLRRILAVLIAHEPVDRAEREDRGGEAEERQRLSFRCVEDDELPDEREERDQHHGAHLHDALPALEHAQDRVVELERDQHGQDHAENGLEDRLVGGVDQPEDDEQGDARQEMEQRHSHDEADEPGQDQ